MKHTVWRRILQENVVINIAEDFHQCAKDCCPNINVLFVKSTEVTDVHSELEALWAKQGEPRCTVARKEKNLDKEKAKEANSVWDAITMDLQSVPSTPCGNVSSLYYAGKFSSYNFTVYDQASGDGSCMLWDESQGHRGSNEIYCFFAIPLSQHVQ